ncbi:Rad4p NDAI_0C06060 [Naumovozyma dairenensis CBS 421]|uniref:Rad4 beta-hairpin domain-containing protein n=1 Tax=Naumovozyma dairenensis (strain ATCC 10597 / BCRC 20456 / CBS 421 / NBRC 0211 / NRRL Y-12639) TaxID=1071378 RepID=G0W904_NAUDC|nr:hypothetical protein NDAI_0C06060 [Naumovozyma dairenensis CBS 421]CCD24265.1 hypothetical protein NDAI_0C06060 [Naumovozyma dairenensis CBS 421]
MNEDLPKEYFELIRKTLREKRDDPATERPLKRRKRRSSRLQRKGSVPKTDDEVINISESPENEGPHEVIALGSDSESSSIIDKNDKSKMDVSDMESEDENYDSDEFEDVTNNDEDTSGDNIGDLKITINQSKPDDDILTKNKRKSINRNICSNEERKKRYYLHMFYLICLMVHGSLRNEWINSSRFSKKLSSLVPEKVFELLHPEKDEFSLRSTRKLLDGLKKCMEIWQKHWRITQKYNNFGCYMRFWDEIEEEDSRVSSKINPLTKQVFIRRIIKGHGDRDLAAQGFVAMLRACNVNARLVLSCQPPDFTDLKVENKITEVSYEDMTKFPLFWCEVWDKFAKKWITIDVMNFKTIEQIKIRSKLEPQGVACCKRNNMRYVIGYDRKHGCRDITRRYTRWYNCKIRKKRVTKDEEGSKWYSEVLNTMHRRKRTKIDDYEDAYFEERNRSEGMPDNLQDLKNHPYYILEKDLRQNQVIRSGCKESGYLKLHGRVGKVLKVYERKNILDLKSGKQWYMEGRILKTNCKSLKTVKKKTMRGPSDDINDGDERLYPVTDTELYIPPLATETGEITKNTFGNIEVFVPTMIPQNCCLIENPNAIKAAKFLRINYARAVTGFKFERGRSSKPNISGIVVAKWFAEAVVACIDGIEYCLEQDEKKKQELQNLSMWHKLLSKLRIKMKLNMTYGSVNIGASNNTEDLGEEDADDQDEQLQGGGFFVPTNGSVSELAQDSSYGGNPSEGGFLVPSDGSDSEEMENLSHEEHIRGGFVTPSKTHVADENLDEDTNDGMTPVESDGPPHDDQYEDFMNELNILDADA